MDVLHRLKMEILASFGLESTPHRGGFPDCATTTFRSSLRDLAGYSTFSLPSFCPCGAGKTLRFLVCV